MHQPGKKNPTSGRAAFAQSTNSALGFSAGQVREQLHRPTPAQLAEQERARAHAAQQRRYQQITRSGKGLAQPPLVAKQDGAIAYYAQAQMRAELKYRAQTAQRLHIEKEAAAQFAASRKYIHQGNTPEESRRGRAAAVQRKLEENTREMMQAQPEATGIASGVGVGFAMVSQVVAPELALARLAGTLRWMGAARAATAVGRVGTALAYQGGPMTWKGVGGASKVFLNRAGTDVVLQYAGALTVNAGQQYEQDGQINARKLLLQSVSGVNATSAIMAGLPGDDLIHSFRNAAFANLVEANYDIEKGWGTKHVVPTWGSVLNYGQKVGLSVGGDYMAGRFGDVMQKARRLDSYRSTGPLLDPHAYALWRQRMWLLKRAEFIGVNGTKVSAGVAGSLFEPYITSPAPDAPPVE
jgi:hypothetical protein